MPSGTQLVPSNYSLVRGPFGSTELKAISILLLVPFLIAPALGPILIGIGIIAAAITIITAAIATVKWVIGILAAGIEELTAKLTRLKAREINLRDQLAQFNIDLSARQARYDAESSAIDELVDDERKLAADIYK